MCEAVEVESPHCPCSWSTDREKHRTSLFCTPQSLNFSRESSFFTSPLPPYHFSFPTPSAILAHFEVRFTRQWRASGSIQRSRCTRQSLRTSKTAKSLIFSSGFLPNAPNHAVVHSDEIISDLNKVRFICRHVRRRQVLSLHSTQLAPHHYGLCPNLSSLSACHIHNINSLLSATSQHLLHSRPSIPSSLSNQQISSPMLTANVACFQLHLRT